VEVQVGTVHAENAGERLEQLNPIYQIHEDIILIGKQDDVEFGLSYSLTLDVTADDLEGKKVYVATWSPAEDRWFELGADYAITTDYSTLVILLNDMPELTGDDADLNLVELSPGDADAAIDGYSVAVIYAGIPEEAERCEAFAGEWMDVTLEWDHPNGYCAVQGDDYWDALHPATPRLTYEPGEPLEGQGLQTAAFSPPFRGTAFIITANVGHSWGTYNCCQDMYKLSNAAAEQRIHDNLNVLDPDILLLQELGNRFYWNTFASEASSGSYTHHALSASHKWPNDSSGLRVQVERLIKDAGPAYNYACTRYLPGTFGNSEEYTPHYIEGMAFECVVWNTAKFTDPTKLPNALRGYTVSDGAAGIQLRYVSATRPIRVLSVHAIPDSATRRIANLQLFKTSTYVASGAIRTLWGGDFNLQPAQSGADGDLLRTYVHWGSLVPSDVLSSNPDHDWLRPLRTENQTTAASSPLSYKNLDHLFATRLMSGTAQCTVLYQNAHRLDFWNNKGGGMDHRAVACGTSFDY
jgi:endonuclease/exonuclease/phosphatase family metal-dependent hydrolase